MRYTTVIFDLDGTLLDTLDDIMDSVNETLHHFGYPGRTKEQIRLAVGNGTEWLLEKSLPEGKSTPMFEDIVSWYTAYYAEHSDIKTAPYVGVKELLAELSHREYKLAVVSNKPDRIVKPLVRKHFGSVISVAIGEKTGIRRKPAPDTAQKAMEDLFSVPWECCYVGDSDVDIQTAKNAGIDCLSVSWGFRTEEFLKENGAVTVVSEPKDVLKYL